MYATSPLDRCLRDARTAVQHAGTQETNFGAYDDATAEGLALGLYRPCLTLVVFR